MSLDAGRRALVRTDDAPPEAVWTAVLECAMTWEADARILGNVRAGDIARAARHAIEQARDRRERRWGLR